MNRKIVITGSNGFVGKNIYIKLLKFYNVNGIDINESKFTDTTLDILNREELFKFLNNFFPEIIIHCAYYPHVDGCEINPEKAYKINIEATNNIVDWCRQNNKKLIFISTDYVYSKNGDCLNNENSEINALNIYTQNKIDNENKIKMYLKDFLIFRTGFIYGYDLGGKNFLMQMIESKGNIKIPTDQIINPTNISFLTKIIEKSIELDLRGTFNSNGKESISRFEFGKIISKTLGLENEPEGVLTQDIDYKAKRPLYCRVDSSLIYKKTDLIPKSIPDYLFEIKKTLDEKVSKSHKRDDCRACRGKKIVKVISMGKVPIANSFLKEKNDLEKLPLDIYFCKNCGLVQILDVISSEELFEDYRYLSSVSQKVINHFSGLATLIKERFILNDKEIVLEIGSNDGVLLKELENNGIKCIGVDPSINVSKIARDRGFYTINYFFNYDVVKEFVKKFGKAKVITGSNVFAHIDNLDELIKSVYEALDDKGIFIAEVHYLIPQIENFQFDNFYHEHLCEWSAKAFNTLLNRFDMELYNVEKIPIHGGSIRFFSKKKINPLKIEDSVKETIDYEEKNGFLSEEKYIEFSKKIELLKEKLITKLQKIKDAGGRIAGYGASARGTILLNTCNINENYLDYVVDNSTEKQGRYIPGVNIKIVPASHLKENPPNNIFIIAYTYAKEIMKDEEWFIEKGGEFILPNIDIFDN
ncbi:MAG: sugar nucleotide-binding protein [Nanoarchaeota archaeon]